MQYLPDVLLGRDILAAACDASAADFFRCSIVNKQFRRLASSYVTKLDLSTHPVHSLDVVCGGGACNSALVELTLNCEQLTDLRPLTACNRLAELALLHARGIDISPLFALTGLTQLEFGSDIDVRDVQQVSMLTGLSKLTIQRCSGLRDIAALTGLSQLEQLSIVMCNDLTDINALVVLTGLSGLDIQTCNRLADFAALGVLTKLTCLNLGKCSAMTDVVAIGALTGLKELYLNRCSRLENIAPPVSAHGSGQSRPRRHRCTDRPAGASRADWPDRVDHTLLRPCGRHCPGGRSCWTRPAGHERLQRGR